jgi:CHAT domain-containing protein
MPLATAQTEYNIAYLSFLKGRYGHAIELLRTTCKESQKAGDAYRAALCQLDLSEIYLELNLNHEAEDLAQLALTAFESLGIGYEAAKARCQSAMALGQQGKTFRSQMSFAQARMAFANEKNPVWPSLIDLYQALAYFNDGRIEESRRYCLAALNFFRDSPLRGRAILCWLLLARLSLSAGEIAVARRECESALAELTGRETPILVYQTQLVMGRIEEASGNLGEAENRYRAAKDVLETLRCGLYGEELKISFLENKLEVYENLVELYLARDSTPETREEAWICMEQAKSRSLLELIASGANPRASEQPANTGLALKVTALREKLNWHYHRIEIEELAQVPSSTDRLFELRRLATQVEKELVRLTRELSSERSQDRDDDVAAPISLELTRQALGPDTTLIEYFRTRDKILAAVITERDLDVVEITTASRISESLDMLRFQFMKPRLGLAYVRRFQQSLLDATQARLHDLYKELLGPVRDKLRGKHLIVVPHQSLHRVPFHALYDGSSYLADSFSISYAPSASIYVQCRRRPSSVKGTSLILGIPSPDAPQIADEVRLVEAVAPNPKVFVGPDASEAVLRQHGPQSSLIHIATHGLFREDSPMFSSIRLGDTFLTPYDLYRLVLPVDQITLSCCSTGLNVVTAGDEVMGLTRGLLCAGAKSLLLSLWDVNDTSTAAFMNVFYSRFFSGQNRALAFQGAIQDLRQLYPHPYYWAPFVLVGDIS